MKGGTPDGSSFPAFLHLRTIPLTAMEAFPNHCPQFGSWQEGAPLLLLLVFIISLIRLWLGIFFSMFFVLRVHWTSGICEFINVIKFGKSLAVIPWNTFFPSQASSFWVLNYTYVWHLEVVLQLTDDLLFIIIIIIFSQIHLELFSCYIFKLLVFFFWHV